MSSGSHAFLCGVIEGFYGRPWTAEQRCRLFFQMETWGLNTYLYAPKDDLKHRRQWREMYDQDETRALGALVERCHAHGLRFIYALAPGLDIGYGSRSDFDGITRRFEQLIGLGIEHFAALFDDIPETMSGEDRRQFGSFGAAHAHVANRIDDWLRQHLEAPSLLFCPTPYCGRMDGEHVGGEGYLDEIGKALHNGIHIFWTGPEIVSRIISEDHLDGVAERLRRKPLLWDNLYANDYDLRRLHMGPYTGRPESLPAHTSGVLLNPNVEFEANFVPVRTLALAVTGDNPTGPRDRFLSALTQWLPVFESVGETWTIQDLIFLADFFYLPHETGEQARRFLEAIRFVVDSAVEDWGSRETQLRDFAARIEQIARKLTELKHRELVYTFNRQWWELREETELLIGYLDWRKGTETASHFTSPHHLPHTFRGGVVAAMQRLIEPSDLEF